MVYDEFFAKRLTTLREQHEISAREMSLAIGQNESYINRIENQKTFPSMQAFFYICEYLNILPKDFFDDGNTNPQAIKEITESLKKLTPGQLQIVNSIVAEFIRKNN